MGRTGYVLHPDESVGAEMRRVVRTSLSTAIAALEGGPTVGAVHTARKACKRARAALDLIPGPAARAVTAKTRDGARCIAAARDADVMAALAKVASIPGAPTQAERERDARLALRHLRGARQLAFRLPFDALTDGILVKRITRTYRRSRLELRHAHRHPAPEQLHEWRKALKRLLFQATLLAPRCPSLSSTLPQLDELQEHLGDHHDLSALIPLLPPDPARVEAIAQLESRALTHGAVVLGAGPGTFAAWLGADAPQTR